MCSALMAVHFFSSNLAGLGLTASIWKAATISSFVNTSSSGLIAHPNRAR